MFENDLVVIFNSFYTGLVDIHDNWWKDLHRQAERAENICDDMATPARQDASRTALVKVLVLLHTFKNQVRLLDVRARILSPG